MIGRSTLVAAVCLAIAAAIAPVMYRDWRRRRWRIAAGRVVESAVRKAGPTKFEPVVRYEFAANGQSHAGDQIPLPVGQWSQYEDDAREIATRYPVGAAVRVSFDPANPQDSVIGGVADRQPLRTGFLALLAVAAVMATRSLPGPGGYWLAVAISVAFMVHFASQVALRMRAAAATLRWPSVDGVITISAVESISMRGPNRSRAWRANVMYAYRVGDTEHVGGRVAVGADRWWTDSRLPEAFVRQYPRGAAVQVYFDPANPDDAVLQRGRTPRPG